MQWIKIAESVEELPFGSNDIAEITTELRTICIGRYKGQLFAFAPKCPHASGPLCAGDIDQEGNVICPLHRYKFSMKTGRNVSGEGYHLKHWPVEIREDGVYAGLERSKLFGWF